MEVKFKYSVGDTVTLAKLPTPSNLVSINKFLWDTDFKPKNYRIEQCKCVVTETNEIKIYYNLYAYCDDILDFYNWIPEDHLEGELNEHVENFDFISHDKELLQIGDDVLCGVFSGDYDNPYLMPELTFTYVGTITRFEYIMDARVKNPIRKAIIQSIYPDDSIRNEFVPYLVKNLDRDFVYEYILFCKKNRFNPINEIHIYSKHDKILKYIKLWDVVIEVYNNWNKEKKKKSTKPTEKKNKKNTTKEYVEKLLGKLSEEEKNELRKQLSNE